MIWTPLNFTHLYCEEKSLLPPLMDCPPLRQIIKTAIQAVKVKCCSTKLVLAQRPVGQARSILRTAKCYVTADPTNPKDTA